jgi:uncharacterized protein (TIRG00374 family)
MLESSLVTAAKESLRTMKFTKSLNWFFRGTTSRAQNARRITKILALLILFVSLLWIVPVNEVIRAMLTADPWYFALGLATGFLSLYLTSVQMVVLIRKQRINIDVNGVFVINLAAKFYSQFAPGNIVASGVKWYRLSTPDGKPAEALVALAFFRLLETFLNVVAGLCFWIVSGQQSIQITLIWPVALIIGTTLLWIGLTRYSLPIYEWIKEIGRETFRKPPWQAIMKRFDKFIMAVSAYSDLSPWELLWSIFAGLASLLVGVLSNMFLARSVGIGLSFVDMGWIYAVVILLAQLPFVPAGGLGVREVSLVFMLSTFGIGPELALAFSFMILIRGLLISVVGGLLEAIQAVRAKRPAELNPTNEKPEEL